MLRHAFRRRSALFLCAGLAIAGAAFAQDDNPFENPPADPAPAQPAEPFKPGFGDEENPFGDAAPAPAAPAGEAPAGDTANPFASGENLDVPVEVPKDAPVTTPPAEATTLESTLPADGAAPAAAGAEGFGAAPAAAPAAAAPQRPAGGVGISQLFVFRYVKGQGWDGKERIIRKQMTRDEGDTFDQANLAYWTEMALRPGETAYRPESGDPQSWAQWRYYAEQVELWCRYNKEFILAEVESECDYSQIRWPGDPKPGETLQASGGTEATPTRNIYNENRSLDDQLGDFSPVQDTRGQNSANQVIDPAEMDKRTAALYACWDGELRTFEEKQAAFMKTFIADLDDRARTRTAYQEWRDSQKEVIMEYVNEWSRRYEGRVVSISGVRYELYRPGAVPTSVPRGANVVVTDGDLTPYDLLSNDGSLRGASRQ